MSMRAESILDGVTEKDFQRQVVQLATLHGWVSYHTFDARRSESGFPDLICLHPRTGAMLVAELKSERGRLSPAQKRWLAHFERSAERHGITVRVWRPSSWPDVEATLARRGA